MAEARVTMAYFVVVHQLHSQVCSRLDSHSPSKLHLMLLYVVLHIGTDRLRVCR